MPANSHLHNPHLEGAPFYWKAGPVGVLLSHGFTATPAEVRPLAQFLFDHGYTIAGPLLPGHSTQPEDLNNVHWQDWVAEVESAYQRLRQDCQQVFVGGESTGALLALYLAIQHPEAQGILAYAPGIKLAVSKYDRIRLRLLAPFIPSVPKGSLDRDDRWQGYPVNPLKGAIQLLNLQEVVRKRLHEIHQPLLIVQGRLDTTLHPTAPEILTRETSSMVKEVHWMEKSTHVVILDQELEEISRFTLDFIQRFSRTS